jgi:preprotein translocase subunit SecA
MVIQYVSNVFSKIFGSRNDRMLKRYRKKVELINQLEPEIRKLTDDQLRERVKDFRARSKKGEHVDAFLADIMAVAREAMDRHVGIRNIFNPEAGFDPSKLPGPAREAYDQVLANIPNFPPTPVKGSSGVELAGWQQVPIPNIIYEAVRELYPVSRPPFRARPFDVQLIGGMVLGEGRIAEMKTGEGKTIVAPLACFVACMENLQVHVVTVNDYLVQRDRDWVFPFYHHSGLFVGAIHPFHMQSDDYKREAYHCDVVYGTNSEFGFDYLRDNMKLSADQQVQKRREFCVIDEVDSILIDEARTPLIISGPAHDTAPRYGLADQAARHLMKMQREWDRADQTVQQTIIRIKGLEGDIRNTGDKGAIAKMRDEMKRLQGELPKLELQRDKHKRYYEVEKEKRAAHLTHDGIAEAQKFTGIGSFYVGNNIDMPHLLENALRAHVIYNLDKEYVVHNGEIVIVDEFTGRLMIGRQWSDGLHQAIETKEAVKVKEETQTFATITIQNNFRLYKRLSGMTGTGITEATEFYEIYGLDVVCIPTNLPIQRVDRNDAMYMSAKDKWTGILDEIKMLHDLGRPVLVGTTSVEKSQMLSGLLEKRYGIPHAVLNAKQHDREAAIVAHAGELGAVMIATNMAGRGTDIKLQPVTRDNLIRHWQQRDILPSQATPDMPQEQIVELAWRHMATQQLGLSRGDAASKPLDELKLELSRHWILKHDPFVEPGDIAKANLADCLSHLDTIPNFMLHKLSFFKHVEEMGGLHIVGTERHEARRIDNQLRGRAGRQGDQGSSRFFISMEDDLMQAVANKTMLNALSRLGMKEGAVLEHRFLNSSVERCQRKVEERNYQSRKNLLEYDEVMEHQRNSFYGLRQAVLDGKQMDSIIFDYLSESVEDAVSNYLGAEFAPSQIAEWCRQNLSANIETYKLRATDIDSLKSSVASEARSEIAHDIDVTLGEFMSNDDAPEDWDLKGLAEWAETRFSVTLPTGKLREMNVDEVRDLLRDTALESLETKDLTPLEMFLGEDFGATNLRQWIQQKFEFDIPLEELRHKAGESTKEQILRVEQLILDKARNLYRQREVRYPAEFTVDMAFQMARHNGPMAAAMLCEWAKQRYELELKPDEIVKLAAQDLINHITEAAVPWHHGEKLNALVEKGMREHTTDAALHAWAKERLGCKTELEDLEKAPDKRAFIAGEARKMIRQELTSMERYVLLQILDDAWKAHLYAMEQLKESVGLRGYAEKDPRIEYKREGSNHFASMQRVVRDRVTDLIFKIKMTANLQMRDLNAPEEISPEMVAEQAALQGTPAQQAALEAARNATPGDDSVSTSVEQEPQRVEPARPKFKDRRK